MKDEIKEILDYCNKYINDKYMQYSEPTLNTKSLKLLLDYITNLQEEIKSANESITWWQNRFNALQEENHRLKELCDKYEEEHSTTFEYWKQLVKEDYKSRNEKAIEYIKDRLEEGCLDKLNYYDLHKIESILQGEDKDVKD